MSSSHTQRLLRDRSLSERGTPCFQVSADCRFWWPTDAGDAAFGLGRTTELGTGGVSVLTSVLPPLGEPIMLEVDLPHLDLGTAQITLHEEDLPMVRQDTFLVFTAEGTVQHYLHQGHGFKAVITHISFAHQEKRNFA